MKEGKIFSVRPMGYSKKNVNAYLLELDERAQQKLEEERRKNEKLAKENKKLQEALEAQKKELSALKEQTDKLKAELETKAKKATGGALSARFKKQKQEVKNHA